jgi:DNA-binding transcriptional ArsR family regulator
MARHRNPRLPLGKAATLFGLLGSEGRLRLLLLLAEKGEQSVADLCEALGASSSALNSRLRPLRMARVIRTRRQGQQVFYSLDSDVVRQLLRVIE